MGHTLFHHFSRAKQNAATTIQTDLGGERASTGRHLENVEVIRIENHRIAPGLPSRAAVRSSSRIRCVSL
jgi:hypothetical protein